MPTFPFVSKPFNSASVWASTFEDLQTLYCSPYTGALTTRTACSADIGFPHDEKIHQHIFFSTSTQTPLPRLAPTHAATTHPKTDSGRDASVQGVSTLNTLGYSPYSLRYYIQSVQRIQRETTRDHKPVIFSVAGSSTTILACYALLANHHDPLARPYEQWCMEINLSCPNIPGAAPPAYSVTQLTRLLEEISSGVRSFISAARRRLEELGIGSDQTEAKLKRWNIPIGLKLPPYTYARQFDELVQAVACENSKIREVATNSSQPSSDDKQQRERLINDNDAKNFMSVKNAASPDVVTIDTALLTAAQPTDLDATLAEDLAVSLSLDDALSRSPSSSASNYSWSLLESPFPISFVTSTNTLGSCLNLRSSATPSGTVTHDPVLNSADGSGLGGLAGAALHPLSLGNVKSITNRLRANEDTKNITVIGVGGVCDRAGVDRMKSAGAEAVALATALGAKGVLVFEEIDRDYNSMDDDDDDDDD